MEDMQPAVRFQFLGLPCVVQDKAEVPLAENRPIQLLAHLAVRRSWQSRDELARLFWPDRSKKTAHSNLRNLLFKTTATAPFAPVEATEHALRLRVPSDLDDFEAAVQRNDWEAAVRIGAADLLQGYESNATEPYQQWLQGERQTLLAQWIKSIQAMLAQSARPLDQRQALAESWALRCPYDEEAVHARVSIAFERRLPGSATAIFRVFEATLQEEFGVRPSRALERFALDDAPQALQPAPSAPMSTPTPTPSLARARLFGRRLELRQLKSLMADNSVRLITLTGPGGAGKSTLMAAVHEQCVADGRTDTWLIDASAAQGAQAVIAAIAAALGIEGLHGEAQEAPLAATLRDRRCLLLIDGAEQAGLAAPLALLLDRCPQTRLLIAARSRMQLDNERVLLLDGFPLPDADEADTDVLGSNDGVGYFIEVMNQMGQPVNLARDAGTLVALVHAVEGLPLALKLLAKLTRVFSLPQLLDSVREQMMGARQAGSPALGELMPALVASFERSWTALLPAEQAVLARLAVFPAAFDVSAARAVAATELPLIISLVDRSLLRSASAGRLSLHAGIRACVLAACPLADSSVSAYLEFHAQRLATLTGAAKLKTVRPRNQFLRDEAVHVEHAWQLALQRRAYASLLSMAESLWIRIQYVVSISDYGAWFVEAEQLLREEKKVPSSLRALLLSGAARAGWYRFEAELAESRAREALIVAQRARHPGAILLALETLGMVCLNRGRLEEAGSIFERASALGCEVGESESSARILLLRARLKFQMGDLEAALQIADEHALICRRFEDTDSLVFVLSFKLGFCHSSGDKLRTRQLLDQLIEATSASGVSPAMQGNILNEATLVSLDLGDIALARTCLDTANAVASRFPQSQTAHFTLQLANAALEVVTGELAPAVPRLAEVLSAIGRGEARLQIDNTFLATAMWFRSAGDKSASRDVLRAVGSADFDQRSLDDAESMLRELGDDALPSAQAGPAKPATEVADLARRRMLILLDEMRRSKRLQAP